VLCTTTIESGNDWLACVLVRLWRVQKQSKVLVWLTRERKQMKEVLIRNRKVILIRIGLFVSFFLSAAYFMLVAQ